MIYKIIINDSVDEKQERFLRYVLRAGNNPYNNFSEYLINGLRNASSIEGVDFNQLADDFEIFNDVYSNLYSIWNYDAPYYVSRSEATEPWDHKRITWGDKDKLEKIKNEALKRIRESCEKIKSIIGPLNRTERDLDQSSYDDYTEWREEFKGFLESVSEIKNVRGFKYDQFLSGLNNYIENVPDGVLSKNDKDSLKEMEDRITRAVETIKANNEKINSFKNNPDISAYDRRNYIQRRRENFEYLISQIDTLYEIVSHLEYRVYRPDRYFEE